MTDILTPAHRTMLETDSAIAPDVIAERGWLSLSGPTGTKALLRHRFADYQAALMPGLLVPVHTTDGQVLPIIWRPDTAWTSTDAKGTVKTRKYVQAEGSDVRLDCPPRCRPQLLDADIPLWVTEGYRKGDCLASQDLCVIDLPGVWGFRVPKRLDPKQPPLPDWKYVQLGGRLVTVVFDSDVRTNPDVARARDQLARFLTSRGAQVRYCTLADLPTGGKCGVDDFLAAGHTLADLEGLSSLFSLFSQLGEKSEEPVLASEKELNSLFSLFSQPRVLLCEEALHGVAGELVRLILPHTEADPAAILFQFLVYFGVLVGRQPYYSVGGTRHHPNLFGVLVGQTSRGRKGTAYDVIDAVMHSVDTSWALANIVGGCGSGEGLIYAVRDPVIKREPIKAHGKVTGYEDVMTDPGVIDKRLLVHEPEFASVLQVASRQGNILSMTLRQAWDSGNLQNAVKTSPYRATHAHIALLGHITTEELQKLLSTTEAANGFGNRFLWMVVQRSKMLPDGGAFSNLNMQPIVEKVRKAHRHTQMVTEMSRDPEARRAWHAVYPTLSADQPGLAGKMLARGEAQVLRLSMLYALLDCSATIRPAHLAAALALWEYAEASVKQVFGTTTGNREADALREALKWAEAGKMTRTEIISEVFHGHIKAHDLNTALRILSEEELITRQFAPSTGGRRKEYVCYGGSPSSSPLMRTRARYIDLAGLSIQAEASMMTEGCEKSELSEESPCDGADAHVGDFPPLCEKSELSEESPLTPIPSTDCHGGAPDPTVPHPCVFCHGTVFWTGASGHLICSRCHPQPTQGGVDGFHR
jgi:hypothetical protein